MYLLPELILKSVARTRVINNLVASMASINFVTLFTSIYKPLRSVK